MAHQPKLSRMAVNVSLRHIPSESLNKMPHAWSVLHISQVGPYHPGLHSQSPFGPTLSERAWAGLQVKAFVVTRRRESRRRQTKGSKEEMGRWREKEAEDISNEL